MGAASAAVRYTVTFKASKMACTALPHPYISSDKGQCGVSAWNSCSYKSTGLLQLCAILLGKRSVLVGGGTHPCEALQKRKDNHSFKSDVEEERKHSPDATLFNAEHVIALEKKQMR